VPSRLSDQGRHSGDARRRGDHRGLRIIRSILLVRLRLIGDVVFTTPVIRALKRRYPEATLVYLVEPVAAPVVAANPDLDEVIVVPRTRGLQRLADDVRLARQLRARRFDCAIDLHGGPRSSWLTWASRAPIRVGYDVPGRTWMYTHVAHRPRVLRPRHSVENQWDLLTALDAEFASPDPAIDRVTMAVEPGARARLDARLRQLGVPADAQVVVLHVSAGNPFRRWPESSFSALAAGLIESGPRWVILTSGPSDHEAASRVLAETRRRVGAAADRIVDGEGLTLSELRALMDRAALFVGGDSGPLHMAATSDVPVVGLYGPTLTERSAPWRPRSIPTISIDGGTLPCRPCEQHVCVPGDFRCLSGIDPARVLDAARQLLEASR
jgi:predicted lipopolysaccharide heptosyltransferase III